MIPEVNFANFGQIRFLEQVLVSKKVIRPVGPQLSRTSLGNVLLKKQRISADGQNIAQNCTTMRVVETMLLDCSQPPEDLQPILREEAETAVASVKKGKSAGVDNIPAELVQAGGETMIDVLTEICNRIWRTGEWPTLWTISR